MNLICMIKVHIFAIYLVCKICFFTMLNSLKNFHREFLFSVFYNLYNLIEYRCCHLHVPSSLNISEDLHLSSDKHLQIKLSISWNKQDVIIIGAINIVPKMNKAIIGGRDNRHNLTKRFKAISAWSSTLTINYRGVK